MGGDSTDKSAERSQFNFTTSLQDAFRTQFGAQSAVLGSLTNTLENTITNPQGFTPQGLAAARTQAIQGTATDFGNASKAVNGAIAARGGSTLPSGVSAQIQGGLAQGAANEESSQLTGIDIQNAELQNQNREAAIGQLEGVAGMENPTAYGSTANSGAATVAGLSNAYSTSEQSGFGGQLMSGLGAGLAKGISAEAGGQLNQIPGA